MNLLFVSVKCSTYKKEKGRSFITDLIHQNQISIYQQSICFSVEPPSFNSRANFYYILVMFILYENTSNKRHNFNRLLRKWIPVYDIDNKEHHFLASLPHK